MLMLSAIRNEMLLLLAQLNSSKDFEAVVETFAFKYVYRVDVPAQRNGLIRWMVAQKFRYTCLDLFAQLPSPRIAVCLADRKVRSEWAPIGIAFRKLSLQGRLKL